MIVAIHGGQRPKQLVDDLRLPGDFLVVFDTGQRLAHDRREVPRKRQIGVGGVQLAFVGDELRPIELTQLARDLIRDRQVVQTGREFGHLRR